MSGHGFESKQWKKGMLQITIAEELESLEQTWEARGMHDSSGAYPNGFSVPPSPQNPLFIHDKFLLYVGVTTRWYWLQNPRQTRAINKINTGTNHH